MVVVIGRNVELVLTVEGDVLGEIVWLKAVLRKFTMKIIVIRV